MKTYVIAECACEHCGNILVAKKMLETAHQVGADAVKFQLYDKKLSTAKGKKWLEDILRNCRLGIEGMEKLKKYAENIGIDWLCTAFDKESLIELEAIGLKTLKISSIFVSDVKFLQKAAQLFPTIILSTGMSMLSEIKLALKILKQGTDLKNIALLHCVSAYPPDINDLNLSAMDNLWGLAGKVGYSDHWQNGFASLIAVARGAQIIEKHFSLMNGGPDMKISSNLLEFRYLVERIREIEKMLGDGVKRIMPSEEKLLWRK